MVSSHRALFAAAIAVPLGLLAVAGWLNFRQVHAEAERNAMQSVRALSEHAQRTFRAHELLIEFVDSRIEGRTWRELEASEDLHRELARLAAGTRDVASIFVLDPEGKAFISSRRFPMPPIDASDRDYYRALREANILHVSAPGRSRIDGGRFFTLARRRSGTDASFDGLIAVSVDPAYFEAFYATLRESADDSIALIRSDGTMLARDPQYAADGVVLPPGSQFMRQLREQRESGVFTGTSLADGIKRVYAYHRVGDYPVYASFNTSMALVWRHWLASMLPYTLASLLGMGLLLAGVGFAAQRTRRVAAEARGREAEQASRAKDLFVATLSHELRNPLSAISAAAEVLQRDSGSQAAVQIIARQILPLRRMLDDLLDTARVVFGKLRLERRRVDLRELADAALEAQLAHGAARGQLDVRGAEPWIEADPVRLRQLLDNLIENAVKYGARQVDVLIESAADAVELTVRDDGQGIAAELMPRLFEPFVQGEQPLDRAQGGLGLGLALSSRIAALHGGTLSAQSEGPGRGSSFRLRLPRAEAPARAVEDRKAVARRAWRLLVVDDEPDARESLRALLELQGHQVAVAADGPSGLAAIASFAPEAALVDIGLPGFDGYELARRSRAQFPKLPLVAVTGYGQQQDREKVRAAGFAAHLVKPFSYEELARILSGLALRGSLEDAA